MKHDGSVRGALMRDETRIGHSSAPQSCIVALRRKTFVHSPLGLTLFVKWLIYQQSFRREG